MVKRNTKLAIFDCKPILKKPFPPPNSLGKAEERAVLRVMKGKVLSGFVGRAGEKFLGGEWVRKFEANVARQLQVRYAVGYNSATTALQGAIGALGIGPGDEVITTPYTMAATAMTILLNGAVPVFADIEEDTFCIDPCLIEKLITKRTRAILTVNLFGGSSRLNELQRIARKHKLYLIEDNAQSVGAIYHGKHLGTIGDVGVLSFNANKTLQAGEGGVVITNNKRIAFRAQLIRNHGEVVIDDLYTQKKTYEPIIGSNYRLTELHAAVALEQMKKLKKLTAPRIELAQYLTKKLKHFSWLIPPTVLPKSTHVYYVYPFRFFRKRLGIGRPVFAKAMAAEGFPLGEGYVKPLHLLPVFQRKEMFMHSKFPFDYNKNSEVSYRKGSCSVAERMYDDELLFTTICNHERTKRDIDLFISAIGKIEAHKKELISKKT